MNTVERLFALSRVPAVGGLAYAALKLLGVERPRSVPVGRGLRLPHGVVGLIVHEKTVLGEGVRLFQGVTIGRGIGTGEVWAVVPARRLRSLSTEEDS